jgi:hypothetical protein
MELLRCRVFHDGADLHIQLMNENQPTDFVHYKDTGVFGTISDIVIKGNGGSPQYVDDLTMHEVEAGDVAGFQKTGWNVVDYQKHLREIVPCCKATATYTANVQSHADNDPTDWTDENGSNTEANVWDSLTDGDPDDYAISGNDVVGSESIRTGTQIAADGGLIAGKVEAIAVNGWRISDDDGEAVNAALTCPG